MASHGRLGATVARRSAPRRGQNGLTIAVSASGTNAPCWAGDRGAAENSIADAGQDMNDLGSPTDYVASGRKPPAAGVHMHQ